MNVSVTATSTPLAYRLSARRPPSQRSSSLFEQTGRVANRPAWASSRTVVTNRLAVAAPVRCSGSRYRSVRATSACANRWGAKPASPTRSRAYIDAERLGAESSPHDCRRGRLRDERRRVAIFEPNWRREGLAARRQRQAQNRPGATAVCGSQIDARFRTPPLPSPVGRRTAFGDFVTQ